MKDPQKAVRLKYPEEELKFPWLSMLLDAYAIVDAGVSEAIAAEEQGRGVRLACRKGCDSCCRSQTDIPLYPHELVGIYWYVTEKTVGHGREVLKAQLSTHTEGPPCPFLIEGACSIHPIRPVACRQFNVFVRPCEEGEDPYFTRRQDVLTPIQDYTSQAFSAVLPFYGIKREGDTQPAIDRIIQTQVLNLLSFDWRKLVRLMENFDSRKT
jgi:Fe-S-cluster containining protein